ncbi:MAG TPA: hypothetical protein VLM89_17780 [Phycisphaerae bacterium]|nr:hypothetical protein [Phycisphaerae bacterium]
MLQHPSPWGLHTHLQYPPWQVALAGDSHSNRMPNAKETTIR